MHVKFKNTQNFHKNKIYGFNVHIIRSSWANVNFKCAEKRIDIIFNIIKMYYFQILIFYRTHLLNKNKICYNVLEYKRYSSSIMTNIEHVIFNLENQDCLRKRLFALGLILKTIYSSNSSYQVNLLKFFMQINIFF